jgi:TPR repeat protein
MVRSGNVLDEWSKVAGERIGHRYHSASDLVLESKRIGLFEHEFGKYSELTGSDDSRASADATFDRAFYYEICARRARQAGSKSAKDEALALSFYNNAFRLGISHAKVRHFLTRKLGCLDAADQRSAFAIKLDEMPTEHRQDFVLRDPYEQWDIASRLLRQTPPLYHEAIKLYLQAANRGCEEAQYSLGCILFHGQGVDANREEAVVWFRRAASR